MRKQNNIQIFNPKKYVNDLKKNKIPFILKKTLYTKKIISKYGTFCYNQPTDLKLKDLGFIMQVKNYALKLNNIPKHIDRRKIFYVNTNIETAKTLKKELYEIDLTGAYWEIAFLFEYISQHIYELGLKVNKKTRLIALGNLAKRTAILDFNGTEFKPIYYESSEKTQNIFFDVALHADYTLRRAAILAGNDYLFYWVDAIFLKGEETKNIVSNWLTANNFKHKIITLTEIKNDRNNLITVTHSDKFREKKRTFNFTPAERIKL